MSARKIEIASHAIGPIFAALMTPAIRAGNETGELHAEPAPVNKDGTTIIVNISREELPDASKLTRVIIVNKKQDRIDYMRRYMKEYRAKKKAAVLTP